MKQLLSLFLFLLPCLALAQYPSNGNQKITLGEQTTADGLVFRGVASDTTLTAKSDTAAYFVLDTVNINLYTYKVSASGKKWIQLGSDTTSLNLVSRFAAKLNISDTATMLTPYWRAGRFSGTLPVANGGTGASSLTPNNYLIRTNSSGIFDTSSVYEVGGNVGINTVLIPNYWVGYTALQIGRNNSIFSNTASGTGSALFLSQNIYNDGSNFRYEAANEGGLIDLRDGRFIYRNAIIGSEDAIATLNNRLIIENTGAVGIGPNTPTARLHIAAGTATASTAPLKFTSQGASLLNPVEAGAVEFNGTNLLFTPSTTRHTVNHGLPGSATLNFPSTTTLLSADLTITVTGAADGDVVSLGVPNAAVNANTSYSAWVSAANTVTVRFNNYSSGTVDPASALFKVFVTK
jgi:hypothetical protein